MFWYLLQFAVIYYIADFCTNLGTQASKFSIYLLALFGAYVTTVILSLILDLLRRWCFWSASLGNNSLLSQQRGHYPRVKITNHVLSCRVPKNWTGKP
jgi:hypothetical protein